MGIFLKRRTLFSLFPSYLPREALNWPFITNLTARPQRCFVSCLVEMDPVVQIRRLLKHPNLLSLFHIYPRFEDELALQLIKNKILHQGCFVPCLNKIALWVLEKKYEFLRRQGTTTATKKDKF